MEHKVIYRITCKCRKIYIGSTGNYERRKREHKSDCYNENSCGYNMKIYKHIRDCCEWNEIIFERLRHIFTDNPKKVEGYFIKLHNSFRNGLNSSVANRVDKEYRKNNKEIILIKAKEYQKKNKEIIAEKRKEKTTCECGSVMRKDSLSRHKRKSCPLKIIKYY